MPSLTIKCKTTGVNRVNELLEGSVEIGSFAVNLHIGLIDKQTGELPTTPIAKVAVSLSGA